jgi:hypothetical protein
MGRYPQSDNSRGSLKWIQRAVNNPPALDEIIAPLLPGKPAILWRSPLSGDNFAEYRDNEFLKRVGAEELAEALADFWPNRGPQWDALATTSSGDILLIEAKAHIGELCSPASGAGVSSKEKIEAALEKTIRHANAKPQAPWSQTFYQLANRLAHLHFLRRQGRKAWLVLVNFVGDDDVGGPHSEAEWRAAYEIVWYIMGLNKRHPLSPFILEVHPSVAIWEKSVQL